MKFLKKFVFQSYGVENIKLVKKLKILKLDLFPKIYIYKFFFSCDL